MSMGAWGLALCKTGCVPSYVICLIVIFNAFESICGPLADKGREFRMFSCMTARPEAQTLGQIFWS